ncbi:M-phase inducer phosphatase 1-like isoform X1 [Mytilus galloprovincialis]|uniref:M-phase inducer phosphatase 1-like isoform X1 n=1 Tax=Mytilus galloprovincialis TaxID=29158 RepID=UPI003F7BBA39
MSKSSISKKPPRLRLPLKNLSNNLSFLNALNIAPSKMNSPVTSLAMNLSELHTGRGGTPRRKLSLSSIDTPPTQCQPTPDRLDSSESGCFMDSPTPLDSPTLEMSLQRFASSIKPEIPAEAFTKKKTIAFRRIQSLPPPMMRLSPVDFQDKENTVTAADNDSPMSPDSGLPDIQQPIFYIEENSSQDSGFSLDSRDFEFAAPVGVPKRSKLKIISEDTCSPLKYSPVKSSPSRARPKSFSGLKFSDSKATFQSDSPLKMCPLASFDEEDVDDGFLDLIDHEDNSESSGVPDTMAKLFSAPVLSQTPECEDYIPKVSDSFGKLFSAPVASQTQVTDEETPKLRRSRSLFNRSQSFDVRGRNKRFPASDDSTPHQQSKRRKSFAVDEDEVKETKSMPLPRLHRCHSETDAMIKMALNKIYDEPDLIADCSKPYSLPVIPGKKQDLKSISSETVRQLLDNEYSHVVEKFIIIDCRYPYEYQGGHIRGAKNIYTRESITEEFLRNPSQPEDPEKRNILIFHCEFSSERGPNLSRFLRQQDRHANKECYPALHYPEVYLLEGGYKVFYEQFSEYCDPISYKPMLHKDHQEDLRHFRIKSKSWAGEKTNRPGFRPLKF